MHTLSDPSDNSADFHGECYHNRKTNCKRCSALENVIAEILRELEDSGLSEEKKARMMFDYKECIQKISAWKAHLLCSVNRKDAKRDILDKRNEGSGLIVMDWG